MFVAEFKLVKEDHECNSADTKLGEVRTPYECAHLCRIQPGCKYFSVGNNGGSENCYQEHTTSSTCPEGWDWDSYNFYELQGNFYQLRNYV